MQHALSVQRSAFSLASIAAVCALFCVAGCTPASLDESPVLAVVNGKPITQSEFDVRWAELPEARQARYQREGGKKKFLEDMISRELLLQEARRRGLDRKLDIREKAERYHEQLALDELVKEIVGIHTEVTQEELEAYYSAHSSALLATERIRAAQIVVTTEGEALDLKRQLEQGADFAKLAQKYSIDQTTKFRGGDLGLYRKGTAPPEIEAVILTQGSGSISDPVRTGAGFALVKVTSRDAVDARSAQVVRERLKQELFAEKRRRQFEAYLAALRETASVRMAEASRLIPEGPHHLSDGSTPDSHTP